MARSRSRSPPRPAPRPAARPVAAPARPAPPPAPAAAAPPPAQHTGGGGGMLGGMMGMVGQGLAFGTGSAVAHRAVDSVMGPRTVTHEHVGGPEAAAPAPVAPQAQSGDACAFHAKAFSDCVQSNGSDIGKCQFYVDMLNDCKRNSAGLSA